MSGSADSPERSRQGIRHTLWFAGGTAVFATAGLALVIAAMSAAETELAADYNIDYCLDVSNLTATTSGCGAFQNRCPAYKMESSDSTFEKYQERLSRTQIDGVSFPRTTRTQYRGIRDSMDQFTAPKVLRAIGGDPTPTIGSRLHWLAQSVLMRPERLGAHNWLLVKLERAYRWFIFGLRAPFADAEAVLEEHGILGEVRTLIACQSSYSERDAAVYAKDLSLKALRHLESKWRDRFSRYLFTYTTPEFASYGDYAGPIHFYSSLYPSMARAYGSKVLVFANTANKTLDLNCWNFRENKGLWSSHDGDRAEFVTAVNVEPGAVMGMWKGDEVNRDEMGRDKSMQARTLKYALMRLDLGGVRYAAILDAGAAGCVMQVGFHFEGCHDRVKREWAVKSSFQVSQIDFGPLIPDGKPLPAIAMVRACPASDTACTIPDRAFAEMPRAARRLTSEERREIASASFRIDGRLFVQRVREAASLAGSGPASGGNE